MPDALAWFFVGIGFGIWIGAFAMSVARDAGMKDIDAVMKVVPRGK